MPNDNDDFALRLSEAIERRVNEQYGRQRRINPRIDPRTAVDLQIKQEKEKLEKKLDEEEDPRVAEVLKGLLAWLPQLQRKLADR